MELADNLAGQGRIGRGSLRRFDDETTGTGLRPLGKIRYQANCRLAVEIGRRQVYADIGVGMSSEQLSRFLPHKLHHALGDSPDEPGLLRDGDEQVGPHHSPPGRRQRISASAAPTATRRQFHDGLVDDEELLA